VLNFVFCPCKIPLSALPRLAASDLVPWPDDFIPAVHVMDPKKYDANKTTLEDRFQHIASLDRRMGTARGDPLPQISFSDFHKKLTHLRKATVAWGSARVEEYFLYQLNGEYDGPKEDLKEGLKQLLHVSGRRLTSLSDFTKWIKTASWNTNMAAVIQYAMYDMWGSSNRWAFEMEKEYTRMLGIYFTGYRADGTQQARKSTGKCAHHFFVKCKGSLVGAIRAAQKSAHSTVTLLRAPKVTMGGGVLKVVTGQKVTKKLPRVVRYAAPSLVSAEVMLESSSTQASAPSLVPAEVMLTSSSTQASSLSIPAIVLAASEEDPSSSATTEARQSKQYLIMNAISDMSDSEFFKFFEDFEHLEQKNDELFFIERWLASAH
jgi:hypothetical protein